MKIDPPDSPNGPEGAGAEQLKDLVLGLRDNGPSSDARKRITQRLVTAGALPPASISDVPPPGESTTAIRVAGKLSSYKGVAVVVALAAGSLLAWRASFTSAEETARPAPPPVAAPAERVESNEGKAAPEQGAPTNSGAAVATVSIDALPSATPKLAATAAASATTHSTPAPAAATPELILIRRAQDALGSDPARALSLADEHATLFPSGELTQEREVVAVDALSKLGRRDDALLRARALVRRFPRTPYVAHLERAVGRPLTGDDSRNTEINPKP